MTTFVLTKILKFTLLIQPNVKNFLNHNFSLLPLMSLYKHFPLHQTFYSTPTLILVVTKRITSIHLIHFLKLLLLKRLLHNPHISTILHLLLLLQWLQIPKLLNLPLSRKFFFPSPNHSSIFSSSC